MSPAVRAARGHLFLQSVVARSDTSRACLSRKVVSRFVVPTVAASVDVVVHTGLDPDGSRAVREIVAVTGRVENGLIESEPVFVRRAGRLDRGPGVPLRRDAFEQVGIDLDVVLGNGRWAP